MKENNITLHNENCVDVMKRIDNNSIDAIVTDPPYGWSFMSKKWDADVPGVDVWKEALRILKPGAHILVACGTRTYHRMVTNIENAGFNVKDCIVWAYGSGMPKSLNISKDIDRQLGCEREVVGNATRHGGGNSQIMKGDYNPPITTPSSPQAITYDGYGTALKPAVELWCLAQKPISEKNIAQNVLKWGTGGINIDGCRISLGEEKPPTGSAKRVYRANQYTESKIYGDNKKTSALGRFPANLILDDSQEVLELFPQTSKSQGGRAGHTGIHDGGWKQEHYGNMKPGYGDQGSASRYFKITPNDTSRDNCIQFSENKHQFNYGNENNNSASRFFYCAKASQKERNRGLQEGQKNIHPTCKPVSLMKYLCRLITPPNSIILDPFMGSGTTAIAAHLEGFRFVGCEIDTQYFDIAKQRVAYYEYS